MVNSLVTTYRSFRELRQPYPSYRGPGLPCMLDSTSEALVSEALAARIGLGQLVA
jgi:hypothetical protein